VNVFADPGRAWRIAAASAVLAAVCANYCVFAMNAEQGWRWCMEDPRGRDGSTLVFPLWTVTGIDGPDRYRISKVVKDIPVIGPTSGLTDGATVSIMARFDGQSRTAVEQVRELHHLRKWKEVLGVLGFVVVAIAAPFVFRVRDGRLEERWRT
jgi:hypothetical protein